MRLLCFSLQDATDGGSSGWLDGETLRLAFVFHNKGAKVVKCVSVLPASMFRRCRVMCYGLEVMDLLDCGRCCELFENLMPFARQVNDLAESFGSALECLEQTLGGRPPSQFHGCHCQSPPATPDGY